MDAKVGDWVVTPRIGKPVEINALWYNALRAMAWFAERLGQPPARLGRALADKIQRGFDALLARRGWLLLRRDRRPDGLDDALRPNQIFAVSLPESPLSAGAPAPRGRRRARGTS